MAKMTPSGTAGRPGSLKLVAAVGSAVLLTPWLIQAVQSSSTGWDFPVFYIAAKLPLSSLYHRAAFEEYWKLHLQPLGSPHWAAYVRPALFSLLLRPLAALPYAPALWTWMLSGLAAYCTAVVLILKRFHASILLLPAFTAYVPAILGLIGGGDTTFYLLALVLGLLLLDRGRDTLAAVCFVLCLCKFNIVLLVPVMLAVQRRGKALAVFAFGGGLVGGASLLIAPLHEYLDAIAQAQAKTAGFFPVGLRGATGALGWAWSYPILVAFTIAICIWLMRGLPAADALAVAITGSLMISPYVCWYDSTLLALPVISVWSQAGKPVRVLCVLTVIAIPLWKIGGGTCGLPTRYLHALVETAIVAWYCYHRVRTAHAAVPARG